MGSADLLDHSFNSSYQEHPSFLNMNGYMFNMNYMNNPMNKPMNIMNNIYPQQQNNGMNMGMNMNNLPTQKPQQQPRINMNDPHYQQRLRLSQQIKQQWQKQLLKQLEQQQLQQLQQMNPNPNDPQYQSKVRLSQQINLQWQKQLMNQQQQLEQLRHNSTKDPQYQSKVRLSQQINLQWQKQLIMQQQQLYEQEKVEMERLEKQKDEQRRQEKERVEREMEKENEQFKQEQEQHEQQQEQKQQQNLELEKLMMEEKPIGRRNNIKGKNKIVYIEKSELQKEIMKEKERIEMELARLEKDRLELERLEKECNEIENLEGLEIDVAKLLETQQHEADDDIEEEQRPFPAYAIPVHRNDLFHPMAISNILFQPLNLFSPVDDGISTDSDNKKYDVSPSTKVSNYLGQMPMPNTSNSNSLMGDINNNINTMFASYDSPIDDIPIKATPYPIPVFRSHTDFQPPTQVHPIIEKSSTFNNTNMNNNNTISKSNSNYTSPLIADLSYPSNSLDPELVYSKSKIKKHNKKLIARAYNIGHMNIDTSNVNVSASVAYVNTPTTLTASSIDTTPLSATVFKYNDEGVEEEVTIENMNNGSVKTVSENTQIETYNSNSKISSHPPPPTATTSIDKSNIYVNTDANIDEKDDIKNLQTPLPNNNTYTINSINGGISMISPGAFMMPNMNYVNTDKTVDTSNINSMGMTNITNIAANNIINSNGESISSSSTSPVGNMNGVGNTSNVDTMNYMDIPVNNITGINIMEMPMTMMNMPMSMSMNGINSMNGILNRDDDINVLSRLNRKAPVKKKKNHKMKEKKKSMSIEADLDEDKWETVSEKSSSSNSIQERRSNNNNKVKRKKKRKPLGVSYKMDEDNNYDDHF